MVSITIAVTAPTVDPGAPPDTITKNINEVTAAVVSFTEKLGQCFQHPQACDANLVYVPGGRGSLGLRSFLDASIQSGAYLSSNTRGSYIVVEAVTFPSDAAATATSCVFDAGITLGPADSTGNPTVLDDSTGSRRTQQSLVLVDGEWRVTETTILKQLGAGNQCPPKS